MNQHSAFPKPASTHQSQLAHLSKHRVSCLGDDNIISITCSIVDIAPRRHFHALNIAALVFFIVFCHGLSGQAAGRFDPEIDWRTIESPRFLVHYPEGARNLGIRISRMAEQELDRISDLFGYAPDGKINIILTDAYDRANGSATVLPQNTVTLYLAAPTELTGLSSYEDWLRLLVIHELAHICDIDQSSGITAFLRGILGSYIQWNGFSPQFLTEGVAVYAETLLTPTGRGRSTYVDMILRTAALEDSLLGIDQANVFYSDWPGGNAAYYYGGPFHLWLKDKFGIEGVRDLHRLNASMPLPYIYWPTSKYLFGEGLASLWSQWQEDLTKKARDHQKKVTDLGLTPSRRITTHGRNITGSRYSPDGTYIIYSRSSPVDGATVRRVDRNGDNDRYLVLETYSRRFSFETKGEGFYFSQNATNNRFNNFNDIYRYDLKEQSQTRLVDAQHPKTSLRARDPHVSSDSKHLVFVQNKLHQSWVSVGTFDSDDPHKMTTRVLIAPLGDRQYASPRFSPDGSMVAVSSWLGEGKRDIIIVDSQSGDLIRRLTADAYLDGNPTWSPDGRYVLYESDGQFNTFNIYAYDTHKERFFQVTNVVGGAFQADVSPDGKYLLFRNASGVGFDIHEIIFEPKDWRPVSYSRQAGYRRAQAHSDGPSQDWPIRDWGVSIAREAEEPLVLTADEKERGYAPEGLIPFNHNWALLPAFFFYNNDPTIQVTTFLRDVLGEHGMSLSVGGGLYTQSPNWSLGYSNNTWYPTFSVGYSRHSEPYQYCLATDPSTQLCTQSAWTARQSKNIGASFGLPIARRHKIALNYVYQERYAKDAAAELIWDLSAENKGYSALSFGYAYNYTRGYSYSVSPEHGGGIGLAGTWYSKALGAYFDEFLLSFDARGYINNPLFDNHVLALRGVGALSLGPEFEENFGLGGYQGSSFLTATSAQTYALRGFNLVDHPRGAGVLAAYLEYRFPIWHIERGLWTIPIFFERIHAAFFAEGGTTFGDGSEKDAAAMLERLGEGIFGGRVGAGFEIRANVVMGWGFPLQVRAGLALPLIDKGLVLNHLENSFSRLLPYFTFGSVI
jgi:hypothetical protein